MTTDVSNVKDVLQKLQQGYSDRNITEIDSFMDEVFIQDDDSTIIGTGYREWTFGFE